MRCVTACSACPLRGAGREGLPGSCDRAYEQGCQPDQGTCLLPGEQVHQPGHSGRRSRLTNAPAPPPPPLPGADRSDMEYYITQAKIVLPVLGINLLRASAVSPAGSAGIAPGSRPRRRQLSLSTSRRKESLPRRGKSTVSSPSSKGRMRGSRGSAHRMLIRRCTSRS